MSDFPKHMKYDRQLVLCLLPGDEFNDNGGLINHADEHNASAYANAQSLVAKRNFAGDGGLTKYVSVTARCGDTGYPVLSNLQDDIGENSRVYIVGHGRADSSELGGLSASQLASMIKTLVPEGKKIKRLGLVGCYTGYNQLARDRPPQSLAINVYKLVKDVVVEVTGYTGTVRLADLRSVYDGIPDPSQPSKRIQGDDRYYASAKISKSVTQQRTLIQNTIVPRKIVVNANGHSFAPDS